MFDQHGATDENAANGPEASGFGTGTSGFDPSEMFRNIFTGGFSNNGFDIFGNGGFAAPNLDIEHVMNLSFLEAAKGTTKTVSFSRLESCDSCSGKGVSKGSQMTTCRPCKGSGQVSLGG